MPVDQASETRVRLLVGEEDAGTRLDQFLANRLGGLSRTQIQRLVRAGQVQLGPTRPRPSTPVRAGQLVEVTIPPPAPASPKPEPLPLEIVYEDADLLVVNKPAGMVVHPAAGHRGGTLVNALLYHVSTLSGIGGEVRPGIVHRLDRGTSGLLVVAKHDAAHVELARQFRDREVEKEYVTLVWGLVHAGRRIEDPIGRDPVHRQKMTTRRARRARTAVTRILRAEQFRGVSLLTVALATGRTHQIRVHLSAIGHPVVGDSTYGGIRRHLPAHLRVLGRLARPFLHASRLRFAHPRDGRPVEFTCPLPPDLEAIVEQLRRTAQ
jgi:23S rRNA pseudouridine1911/1915/1917 synthase